MDDAFVGEIRPFAFNYNPVGFLLCNGAVLPVNQYPSLYSVIGNTYGGVPGVNFQLPNLAGQVVAGMGLFPVSNTNYALGSTGGATTETLTVAQMPSHSHAFNGGVGASLAVDTASETKAPATNGTSLISNVVGEIGASKLTGRGYTDSLLGTGNTLNAGTLTAAGGGQPHPNMAPFMTINYCICSVGTFPTKP